MPKRFFLSSEWGFKKDLFNRDYIMNTTFYQTAAISALFYLVPKGLTYLCSHPGAAHVAEGHFDKMRKNFSELRESAKDILGEKTWFILTDIVADNLWFSFLFFKHLTSIQEKNLFRNFDKSLETITALFGFCTATYVVRLGIVKNFPSTKKFIATRSHS